MNLLHTFVQHQVFGRGEILQQDEEMVTVSFDKPYGKKKFLFPASFQDHLKLENEALLTEMSAVLEDANNQIAADQERAERNERIARFRANASEQALKASKAKKKKTTSKKE